MAQTMQAALDPSEQGIQTTPSRNNVSITTQNASPCLDNPLAGNREQVEAQEQLAIHSVFSRRTKIVIVTMTTLSSLFSPVSSFIYLPTLDTLAIHFHRSIADMNLTVTTNQIFQGLAPMFFGDLADQVGRRPVYLLTFCIFCCANLGLALQNSYPALLALRALQSTGSSGTIALGSGVMADIVTSAERGGYIGIVQAGVLLGPALAPSIGGLLTQFLGWRSIFWFLLISGGLYLVAYFIFVPETGRNIVGDGSIAPRGWNKSLIDTLHPHAKPHERGLGQPKIRFPNPLRALRIVAEKDVAPIMFFASMLIVALYCMMVPLPSLFKKAYGFNDLQPFSFGAVFGSVLCGKILDWNYKRVAIDIGASVDRKRGNELRKFPIEKARLEMIWVPVLVASAAIVAWGWTLQARTNLAVPLIVFFVAGLSLSGATGILNTLLVDLYPQSPATVTASFNVCRCLLSAAGTALIQYVIDAMGLGWTFTLLGLSSLGLSPLLWVVLKWGPKWREERYLRHEKEKEAKSKKAKNSSQKQVAT